MTAKELIAECCERHAEPELAIGAVLDRLAGDKPLAKELNEELVYAGIASMVYLHRHRQLTDVKQSAANPGNCKRGLDAMEASARVQERAFLSAWIMPDGRALGDYSGKDLREQADIESAQSVGHANKAAFYSRLAERADGATVRERMTDAQAERLWRNIVKRNAESAAA
jgi:hypothetical protein